MTVKNKVPEGNCGRATPSLRYLQEEHKEIEINNNKGYFWMSAKITYRKIFLIVNNSALFSFMLNNKNE